MKEEITVAGSGQTFWRGVAAKSLWRGYCWSWLCKEAEEACPQCPAKVVSKKELRLSDDWKRVKLCTWLRQRRGVKWWETKSEMQAGIRDHRGSGMALRAIVQNLDFILSATGRQRKVLSKKHSWGGWGRNHFSFCMEMNCRRLRTEARDQL